MTYKKQLLVTLGTAALITLAGCSSSSSSSDPTPSGNNGGFPAGFFDDEPCVTQGPGCYDEISSNRAGTNGLTVNRFDGNWLTDCSVTTSDPQLYDESQANNVRIGLQISGQSATRNVYLYEDSECAVPATPAVIESELSIFYAGNFDDDPSVLAGDNNDQVFFGQPNTETFIMQSIVNVKASSISIDGAAPTTEQQEDLDSRRAESTIYTILGISLDGTKIGEGRPKPDSSFENGRGSDDRILGFSGSLYSYTLQ